MRRFGRKQDLQDTMKWLGSRVGRQQDLQGTMKGLGATSLNYRVSFLEYMYQLVLIVQR